MATKRIFEEDAGLQSQDASGQLSGLTKPALVDPVGAGLETEAVARSRLGYPMLPRRGAVVTAEMIQAIQDELDREDAERAYGGPLT